MRGSTATDIALATQRQKQPWTQTLRAAPSQYLSCFRDFIVEQEKHSALQKAQARSRELEAESRSLRQEMAEYKSRAAKVLRI